MEKQNEILNECLFRMKMLELDKNCINEFKKGNIWESESIGILYEINEEEKKIVENFEKENKGYKVYHIIHNYFEFGEIYNLLYVGTDKKEWKYDREDIKEGYCMVYAYNKTYDYCSEFGTIAIKKNIGGLIRTS